MRLGLCSAGMGRPWALYESVWAPRGEPVPPSVDITSEA